MIEKRYYEKNYEESYYIFDSKTLPESEFDERVEYEGYDVFADSLTGSEIIDLLNENDKLKKENEELKETNRNLHDFRNLINEKNISNEKQRKELQLQMLRLYNYFEDWFEDTMSPNAFSEMWDNVKEDEKWEKR